MGKPKVGRSQLLRMEADLVEAEEKLDALKRKRRTCSECGRPIRLRSQTKKDRELEAEIRAASVREQRKAFRKAQGR